MKRTRVNYTEEQIQFIKDINDTCYNQEIIDKFYEKFGIQLTHGKLIHIKNVRGIKRKEKKYRSNSCLYRNGKKEFLEEMYFNGVSHKEMIEKYNAKFNENINEARLCSFIHWNIPNRKRNKYTKFNEEQKKFVFDNYKKFHTPELARMFNEKFNTNIDWTNIRKFKQRYGLRSGLPKNPKTGTHEKSRKPIYKNQQDYFNNIRNPIGYEFTNCQGKVFVKVKDDKYGDNFVLKSRYIYEKKYGKIPEGYVVVHKDGDTTNCDLKNLKLMKKGDCSYLSIKGYLLSSEEVMDTALLIRDLNCKINKIKEN